MKAQGPLVALDTQILVWGLKKKGNEGLIQRAGWLITQLDQEGAQIMIPSVVVAEYLKHVPENDQIGFLAEVNKSFYTPPFDTKCCTLAYSLWEQGARGRPKGKPHARICYRADTLIVATAKVYGAERFYSHDTDCRRMAARAGLQALDLPTDSGFLVEPHQWGTFKISPIASLPPASQSPPVSSPKASPSSPSPP